MWWFRFDVDAELNKIEVQSAAKPAQGKKSSQPAVSDTVETAGLYVIVWKLFC